MRIPVRAILPARPVLCTPDTPISEVVRLLIENDCSAVAVVNAGGNRGAVGVIANRDVMLAGISRGSASRGMTASDIMVEPAVAVSEELSLEDCARVMEDYGVAASPVVDEGGRCRGVVTRVQLRTHLEKARTTEGPENSSVPPAPDSIGRRNVRHS